MSDLSQSWECVAELVGHSNWVYGVIITPNKKILASVSSNKILLWDLKTQKLHRVLEGHTDIIFSLSISPNGKLIASGSSDKTVGLWDIETGNLVCTFASRKDPIHSVAFSPDGNCLASGGESKYKTDEGKKTTIYLWDVNTKELIRTFSGHDLRINSIAFSPDGKTLASSSNDGNVQLWNVTSGENLHIFTGASTNNACFTSDGKSLLSGGKDGIKVWDVETGELQHTFAEENDFIRTLAIHPKEPILAIAIHTAIGVYSGIEIWDLTCYKKLQYIDFPWSISISFSPDGTLLASGDASAFTEAGGVVKVWRVPNFEVAFDPQAIEDTRKKVVASIVQRQGQSEFRQNLLDAYGYRCCITGCDVKVTLEAAHIVPYYGTETNLVSNGLLLRADIHTLFDLYLLSINPETLVVELNPQLANSQYGEFAGKNISKPTDNRNRPSYKALQWHYKEFIQKGNL
jgi:WD40 repeat protein